MAEGAPGFCRNCGTALRDGMKFCASCGTPLEQQPPQMPQAAAPVPATGGEPVIALIPNVTLKSGFMGMKRTNYTLILTEWRVAFAQVTADMLKRAVADARDDAKASGKGFFGQWGAQMNAYFSLAERYRTMPVDQALAETPGNFAVDRRAIQKVKLKIGTVGDEDVGPTSDRLIIKTTDGKYDLELGGGVGSAKDALRQAGLG